MHTILCILIEISVKIKMAKKNEGSYLSCVTNGEFYFSSQWLFFSTCGEFYRVCSNLKTENKFSCCQKREYRFLGHQIDEKETAHMIKHMIHSSSLTFLSFSGFFWKRNTCHKTKHIKTNANKTNLKSISSHRLRNLRIIARFSQNLHWNLGQQAPSFGSVLAVRLNLFF